MSSDENQAFIDQVWNERGIFVYIDERMPGAILTREMDLSAESIMPRAILAPDLDSAKKLLENLNQA